MASVLLCSTPFHGHIMPLTAAAVPRSGRAGAGIEGLIAATPPQPFVE